MIKNRKRDRELTVRPKIWGDAPSSGRGRFGEGWARLASHLVAIARRRRRVVTVVARSLASRSQQGESIGGGGGGGGWKGRATWSTWGGGQDFATKYSVLGFSRCPTHTGRHRPGWTMELKADLNALSVGEI